MRHTLLLTLILLLALGAQAQVVQHGYVKEYKGRDAKTALKGVEVAVSRAAKVATDNNGSFNLTFNTMKAGAKVSVIRIEKDGYEIFNREALEQWNINPDEPFTVVMCRSDEFRRLRDRYSEVSSASYARQKQKEEEALRRKLKDGRMREEEYKAQIKQLHDDYEDKLANIEEYADRFARIDLSEVSDVERRIVAMVERGELDSAIVMYEQQDYLDKFTKTVAAQAVVANVEKRLKLTRDSMLAAIHRQADAYRMAGGAENYYKLQTLLKGIADADTTNFEATAEYAIFCMEESENILDANLYLRKALCLETANVSLQSMVMKCLCDFDNNIEHLDRALALLTPHLKEDSLSYLPLVAMLQYEKVRQLRDNGYCSPEETDSIANEALHKQEYLFMLYPDASWSIGGLFSRSYQADLALTQSQLSGIHADLGEEAEAQRFCKQAIDNIRQVLAREDKPQYRRDYEDILITTGSYTPEELIASKAANAHRNPDRYMHDLVWSCFCLGHKDEMDKYMDEWINSYRSMPIQDFYHKANFAYFLIGRDLTIVNTYKEANGNRYDYAKEIEYCKRAIDLLNQADDSIKAEYDRWIHGTYPLGIARAYWQWGNTEKAAEAIAYLDTVQNHADRFLDETPTWLRNYVKMEDTYACVYRDLVHDSVQALEHIRRAVTRVEQKLDKPDPNYVETDMMTSFYRTLAETAATQGNWDETANCIRKYVEWTVCDSAEAQAIIVWLAANLDKGLPIPTEPRVPFVSQSTQADDVYAFVHELLHVNNITDEQRRTLHKLLPF